MAYIKKVLYGIYNAFLTLFDPSSLIYKLVAGVLFYFQGIKLYILTVGALVLIDVFTGIYASIKRGEPFSSRKLRKGLLEKLALYLVLMIAVFITDRLTMTIIPLDRFFLTAFVSFLIALYEVTSIAENLHSIQPNIPFLGSLVNIFRKMGTKAVDKMEEKVDDLVDEVTDVKNKLKEKENSNGEQKPE